MSKKILTTLLLAATLVVMAAGSSWAVSGYVSSFSSTYPSSATSSFSCSICHTNVPTRNPYGSAYASAGHNFRTIESADSDGDGSTNIAEINAGTNPGDAASKPATPPPPAACTSFTYSAWSACQPNGTQTRTVVSSSPAGCTGTPPASQLTQACTYVPPVTACTSFTYSAWSACQSNNTQTRTVVSSSPAGCTGTPPASQLTQACTYVPPVNACTSYTYTLGACQPDGTAPVTSAVGIPAGCSGGAVPATTQPCTYVPPTTPPLPAPGALPVPNDEQTFSYDAVVFPVVSSDPAQAMPIGLGSVAEGGDTVDLAVNVGPFGGPVDVSLVIYAPAIDSDELFYLGGDGMLKMLSDAVNEEQERELEQQRGIYRYDGSSDRTRLKKRFRRLVLWKTNVTEVSQEIFSVPVKDLPRGVYSFALTAAPANDGDDDDDNYYRWVTQFTVAKNSRR